MDFAKFLQSAAEEINQEISQFSVTWIKEIEKVSLTLVPLAKILIENCAGGKRRTDEGCRETGL